MDVRFELNGNLFMWNAEKAESNWHKHGVRFEDALTVFGDPLLVLVDAPVTTKRAMRPLDLMPRDDCSMSCMSSSSWNLSV